MSSQDSRTQDGWARPVVLLEDDRTTATLTLQVLAATNLVNPIEHYLSGEQAALRLEAAAASGLLPVLVILDLAVPDLSGLGVLERIRRIPDYAHVPVVMLSGSGQDANIEHAYELGIDAYLVKPAGIHGLPDVIGRLGLKHVLLPRGAR